MDGVFGNALSILAMIGSLLLIRWLVGWVISKASTRDRRRSPSTGVRARSRPFEER